LYAITGTRTTVSGIVKSSSKQRVHVKGSCCKNTTQTEKQSQQRSLRLAQIQLDIVSFESQCVRTMIQPISEFVTVKERIWVCDHDLEICMMNVIVREVMIPIIHTEHDLALH
jgi:ribosomal protein L30/L7E